MKIKSSSISVAFVYVLFFIYSLYFIVSFFDNELSYHLQQPIFFRGLSFLINSLFIPGGFSNYIGAFFSSLCSYGWIGGFFITILISLFSFLVYFEIGRKGNKTIALLVMVIAWSLSLLLFLNYSFKISSYVVLLMSFGLAQLIFLFSKLKLNLSFVLFLVFGSLFISFMLIGGYGLLFIVLIFVVKKINFGQLKSIDNLTVLLALLFSSCLPYALIHFKFQLLPLWDAYFGDFTNNKYYINPDAFLWISALVVVVAILGRMSLLKARVYSIWYSILIVSIGIVALIYFSVHAINTTEKRRLQIDSFANTRNWEAIILECDKDEKLDLISNFQLNRAIFYKYGLLEDGFLIKQHYGEASLLIENKLERAKLMLISDVYFDLGFINESRHWAHEAFTSYGMQPRILKRLVDVNIILAKFNTANKYIQLLKKSLVDRQWAVEKEKYLHNEAKIEGDSIYKAKRNSLPNTDFFANRKMPSLNLQALNAYSSNNKMVFEYLMMNYLFTHDLISIVKEMYQFRAFGYEELPKHIQEGIIIYLIKTDKDNLNLYDYSISDANFKCFSEYSALYSAYKKGNKNAGEELHTNFSDTYWYYIHFVSPLTMHAAGF